MYQYIEFINGSNPYISKTEKDFKWMCEHYVLIPIAENFWKATDRIYYKVVGFVDEMEEYIREIEQIAAKCTGSQSDGYSQIMRICDAMREQQSN